MVEKIVRLCAQGSVAIDNRGLELLQAKPGESEDEAWARMRGKLGTGAHLNETLVTLPHSIPATHGSGATTTPPAGTPGQPDLFPTAKPPTSEPSGAGGGDFNEGAQPTSVQPNGDQPTGDIFGGGGGARKTYQSEKPTSALNLLSQIEKWGVNAGVKVANVNLTVNVATGAQLAALIKKLPADGVLWDLQLETEE
jgi:hypothetical protein